MGMGRVCNCQLNLFSLVLLSPVQRLHLLAMLYIIVFPCAAIQSRYLSPADKHSSVFVYRNLASARFLQLSARCIAQLLALLAVCSLTRPLLHVVRNLAIYRCAL